MKLKIKTLDVVYFLLPALVGYGVAAACPIGSSAGSKVKFRPPSAVFGIVWAILFPLFGLSWVFAARRKNNGRKFEKYMIPLVYGATVFCLGLWEYIYSPNCSQGAKKKQAAWVLLVSIIFILMCLQLGTPVSRILACPLLAWTLFALLMNTTEVQNS
jgi:tryptophan-rich sensory protein